MNAFPRFVMAIGLLAMSLLSSEAVPAAEKEKRPVGDAASDARKLVGVWLAESADMGGASRLAELWTSKLTLTADSFALSCYAKVSKDLRGRFRLDPSVSPKAIDLQVGELDLSEVFITKNKIPACTVRGIYKIDGDRLTICIPTDGRRDRPVGFAVQDRNIAVLSFARANADFTKFPEQVTVTVTGSDGKPVSEAMVYRYVSHWERNKANPGRQPGKPGWEFDMLLKTGADGTAKLAYEQLRYYLLAARDETGKQMGITAVSPASLRKGTAAVILKRKCRLSGTIVCEKLKKAGRPVGWTNVYLLHAGRRIAACASNVGQFEFPVAPGTYTLDAYGADLPRRGVTVTVPAGRSELTVKPIALEAPRLLLLQGGPAPELEGAIAWKGKKVKLADLKGKYVLLEFWGYWCGPCVHSMPVLIELHEKFADKGLAIVGVHVDIDGEVDTPAKYDEKIAAIQKKLWRGKSLPFPVVLTSGKRTETSDHDLIRGGAAAQYGILGYPTTILIDREGKVVGKFHARDAKKAIAEVEKLLSEKK